LSRKISIMRALPPNQYKKVKASKRSSTAKYVDYKKLKPHKSKGTRKKLKVTESDAKCVGTGN
jgi:hypothetical protein